MISIIIPLYNKSQYICRALESIRFQSDQNYEVIIIDDGSRDSSYEVALNWISNLPVTEIGKYRIDRKSNGGAASARNAGVKKASRAYIAFLDADDWWEEHHLRNLQSLVKDYACDVDIFSNAVSQHSNGKIILPKLRQFDGYRGICSFMEATSISAGFIHSSSVCVKRSIFESLKFPEDMCNCEDVITWAKISGGKGFAFNSERTAVYCIDAAEGALNIDIKNYLRFEHEFKSIGFSALPMNLYLFKYYIMHFMFAKMYMKSRFASQWKLIIGRSGIALLPFIFVVICPVWLIKRLRNIRKES